MLPRSTMAIAMEMPPRSGPHTPSLHKMLPEQRGCQLVRPFGTFWPAALANCLCVQLPRQFYMGNRKARISLRIVTRLPRSAAIACTKASHWRTLAGPAPEMG
jgi:hypothetical protein